MCVWPLFQEKLIEKVNVNSSDADVNTENSVVSLNFAADKEI